jgi:hypothetical protein
LTASFPTHLAFGQTLRKVYCRGSVGASPAARSTCEKEAQLDQINAVEFVKWKKSSKIEVCFLIEAEGRDAVEQDLRLLYAAC